VHPGEYNSVYGVHDAWNIYFGREADYFGMNPFYPSDYPQPAADPFWNNITPEEWGLLGERFSMAAEYTGHAAALTAVAALTTYIFAGGSLAAPPLAGGAAAFATGMSIAAGAFSMTSTTMSVLSAASYFFAGRNDAAFREGGGIIFSRLLRGGLRQVIEDDLIEGILNNYISTSVLP
jgi:hypothetical protein